MFTEIFDTQEKFLATELCVDARQVGAGNYCYRFVPLRGMIDQISSLLPPNTPIPSESYLSLQFTASNSIEAANDRY